MLRKTRHFLLIASLFVGYTSLSSITYADSLPSSLQQTIRSQSLPLDSMGIWIKRTNDTQALASHNSDKLFNPASTIKLATTLAALLELGPDYTWRTEIRTTAPIVNGVLRGDLIIRGTGDPGHVSEEHWRMLRDLQRTTGLKRIEGNVILDDSYFNLPAGDPGAFDGQPFRAYNQLPYALHVNSNALKFHIIPENSTNQIRVEVEPPLPGLRINNQLTRGSGSCDAWQRGIRYDVTGNQVTLSGSYPVQCGPYELLRSAVDPAYNAAELFRLHWAQWGGELTGQIRSHSGTPLAGERVMVHSSRPLGDLIKVANKWSHNVMTRHMALTLGAERLGAPATLEKARVALSNALANAGVNTSGLYIENGSGLSRTARITPNQLGQVLEAGWKSPYRPEFMSSMSISGVDGTTRRQYRNDPKAGRMHLKTGLLNQVSAISGYVRSRCDEDIMVVLMINHPEAHQGHGTRMQQLIVDWAYQQPKRDGSC